MSNIKLLMRDIDLLEADMSLAAAFDSLRERNGLTADEVNDLLDLFEDAAQGAENSAKLLTDMERDHEGQIDELERQLNEESTISEQRAARIDDCRHILLGVADLLDGKVKKSQISAKLKTAVAALEP